MRVAIDEVVSIHADEIVSRSLLDACVASGGHALVLFVANDPEASIVRYGVFQHAIAIIGGAVFYAKRLEVTEGLFP